MSDLTHVELLWLEKRIESWIRFGHPAQEQIVDRRRRILSFVPGSLFAFVRWMSNDYGTVVSRIDIVRAVAPGSNASCRLSMPSSRSASTQLTPRLTIGSTSTTVCPSAKRRGLTPDRAIRPGCIGEGSRYD